MKTYKVMYTVSKTYMAFTEAGTVEKAFDNVNNGRVRKTELIDRMSVTDSLREVSMCERCEEPDDECYCKGKN